MVTEQAVLQALSTVQDPEIHRDLVALNMVRDIRVEGANVSVEVVLTTPACPLRTQIERECRDAIERIPGIGRIDIRMGAKVAAARPTAGPGGIPGVKNIVAIASGKGGVGKSTVSVNLAVALAEAGASVGLLDADEYGPSIPLMMGIHRMPEITEDQRIIPLEAHGVKLMSLGFVLPTASTPVIWRGPMIAKTLNQFLRQVIWGELDYLLIDLPPGTGDAQLTLSQTLTMSGVVIVMTPQDVAMTIASRVLVMFRNVKVPILGIVENMSTFICPTCHHETPIFSQGGGRKASAEMEVPFLGEIPLDGELCEGGDDGRPILVRNPHSPAAEVFRRVARSLAGRVSVEAVKSQDGSDASLSNATEELKNQ
ncbi:MAG: ATP-binding protein involved in chromosome partitioning [candidate division NC10 bacterium]|nr:ATP-binding protein involved in chromosome partitioning [candidate division NC10 bacterium]